MLNEGVSRRQFLGLSAAATAGLMLTPAAAFAAPSLPHPLAASHSADVAIRWTEALYRVVRQERLTPPSAARLYAHLGISLYEAVVGGMPNHVSLGGKLNALTTVPGHRQSDRYDWPSVANAAAWRVLNYDLADRPAAVALLAELEATIRQERGTAGVPAAVLARSEQYGAMVGAHLAAWISTDGWAGTLGRTFTPPVGEGLWEKTPPNFGSSLEPHWNEVRFLAMSESDPCVPRPHVAFSTDPGSDFFAQANATYQAGLTLTVEQKATAMYWRDNPDGGTGLPSGHWMLIGSQVIKDRGLDLGLAAESLVKLSVGLADAFSSCWREKYRTNLIRPVTYIQRYIDPSWNSFVNSPAFPEYTSGHSVGSGAASGVLTAMFGPTTFTDTAVNFTGHTPRVFSSFASAAEEAAVSRLYGGIHYPMGIEVGLEQGQCVADTVLSRLRTRRGDVK